MHLCTLGSLILIEPFTHTLHNSFFGIRYLPKVWCLLWPRSYSCFKKSFKFFFEIYFTIFTWEVFHAKTTNFVSSATEILSDSLVRLSFIVPLLMGFWLLIWQLKSRSVHFQSNKWILSSLEQGRGIIYFCFRFLMELFLQHRPVNKYSPPYLCSPSGKLR